MRQINQRHPGIDENIGNEQLQKEAHDRGSQWLHDKLIEVDPVSAQKLHPNDWRRIIRALEVYEKTGKPISVLQKEFDQATPSSECRVWSLHWPRAILHERIDQRVEQMFKNGLCEEVHRLLDLPEPLSKTAAQGVGYREVIDFHQDKQSLPETIELVKQHTRQLAKRQETWLRSFEECQPFLLNVPHDIENVLQKILADQQEKSHF